MNTRVLIKTGSEFQILISIQSYKFLNNNNEQKLFTQIYSYYNNQKIKDYVTKQNYKIKYKELDL